MESLKIFESEPVERLMLCKCGSFFSTNVLDDNKRMCYKCFKPVWDKYIIKYRVEANLEYELNFFFKHLAIKRNELFCKFLNEIPIEVIQKILTEKYYLRESYRVIIPCSYYIFGMIYPEFYISKKHMTKYMQNKGMLFEIILIKLLKYFKTTDYKIPESIEMISKLIYKISGSLKIPGIANIVDRIYKHNLFDLNLDDPIDIASIYIYYYQFYIKRNLTDIQIYKNYSGFSKKKFGELTKKLSKLIADKID